MVSPLLVRRDDESADTGIARELGQGEQDLDGTDFKQVEFLNVELTMLLQQFLQALRYLSRIVALGDCICLESR